jgi:hypothetical protein
MWTDSLSTSEAEYTQHAIDELSKVNWAETLLNKFQENGGIKSDNMPLMFEIRFAYELLLVGIEPEYEYKVGVGDSDIDFRVPGSPEWLIELVSIRESQGAKNATHQIETDQKGVFFAEQMLSSDAKDPHQRPEAEMITAQQKIGEKVFKKGIPTKFPEPQNKNSIHFILIDMRGYLATGGDIDDYRQIAYGAKGLSKENYWKTFYWEPEPGKRETIKGLFEKSNPLKAAPFIQERIHFLGFVCEKEYREGEIGDVGYYLANPHFFSNDEIKELAPSFPLKKHTK